MNFKSWLEYDYPSRSHDYDPGWDYEVDEEPSRQLVQRIERIVQEIKKELLPQLRIFRDFSVSYVKGLGELGKYANGTVSHPIVMLDLDEIQASCKRYDVQCEVGIETTIVHELAHAIEEAMDLEPNEKRAEEFARRWHYNREIMRFE